ncbi:hypothetical protein STEG23_017930, partial [Scotinomys teguina]
HLPVPQLSFLHVTDEVSIRNVELGVHLPGTYIFIVYGPPQQSVHEDSHITCTGLHYINSGVSVPFL